MFPVAFVLLAVAASPAEINVPVQSQYSGTDVKLCLSVPLCAGEKCDQRNNIATDGYTKILLDPRGMPVQIALYDYHFYVTQYQSFNLDFGFICGSFNVYSHTANLGAHDPYPATHPFVSIDSNGYFSFQNIAYWKEGYIHYKATGMLCAELSAAGQPCETDHDFSHPAWNTPPATLQSMTGTVKVDNGLIHLWINTSFSIPLGGDQNVGAFTTVTRLYGSAFVGDFDNDGDVDLEDFNHFDFCFSGPGISQDDPACQDARFDGDGDVDMVDFGIFQQSMGGR